MKIITFTLVLILLSESRGVSLDSIRFKIVWALLFLLGTIYDIIIKRIFDK